MPPRSLFQRMPSRIARFMLVWFALVLGVAAASPLVQPRAMQLVCSADGAVLVDAGGGVLQAGHAHTLDCALCLLANTPPSTFAPLPLPTAGVAAVNTLRVPGPVLALHGAPLPARGPPSLS
ncbi:DUF2946 family protein [Ottowia sp. VDI28]|uniref:DUF2946 family protein n=1 Tax=Ottowia sp. VDI28 TaxID=3133968 RepID=UPI003C2C69D0